MRRGERWGERGGGGEKIRGVGGEGRMRWTYIKVNIIDGG